MEQFALLNTVWALTIVILEVPSGALADRFGRVLMVRAAAVCMVLELGILLFAPRDWGAGLFALFLINRILSGAAEASTSGADEALAYDSLAADGKTETWPKVLSLLMQLQAGGFLLAMVLGGVLYDGLPGRVFGGALADWPRDWWMRAPVAVTFLLSIAAFVVAMGLREAPVAKRVLREGETALDAWKETLSAGLWILQTRRVLLLILAGMAIDSVVRVFLTINSSYYRLIELPEASFGLIGSGMALVGLLIPPLAKRMVNGKGALFNFSVVILLTLIGLIGVALALPLWGAIFALPLGAAIYFLGFFMSTYLNEAVESSRRATVLSFKGLAFNLAYGAAGVLFAGVVAAMRDGPDLTESVALARTLPWWPVWFVVTIVALGLFAGARAGEKR